MADLGICERFRDPKVSETRLAVPGDQDVVLDVSTINIRVYHPTFVLTGAMEPCKIDKSWRCIRPRHACASYRVRTQGAIFTGVQVDGHVPASDD